MVIGALKNVGWCHGAAKKQNWGGGGAVIISTVYTYGEKLGLHKNKGFTFF
jgi:hypothetical protein